MKNDEIAITPRSAQFQRIFRFVSQYKKIKDPVAFTEMLCNHKYPEIMAAMAAVESGFDDSAVGQAGELSMWQILEFSDYDPGNIEKSLEKAISIYEEKKIGTNRNGAIKGYNGSGYNAEIHLNKVLVKLAKISTMKVIKQRV
jgi:hypothetical protein